MRSKAFQAPSANGVPRRCAHRSGGLQDEEFQNRTSAIRRGDPGAWRARLSKALRRPRCSRRLRPILERSLGADVWLNKPAFAFYDKPNKSHTSGDDQQARRLCCAGPLPVVLIPRVRQGGGRLRRQTLSSTIPSRSIEDDEAAELALGAGRRLFGREHKRLLRLRLSCALCAPVRGRSAFSVDLLRLTRCCVSEERGWSGHVAGHR